MAATKLNIFQRGILQKGATAFVYLCSIAIGAFILDRLDKRLFINLAEEAQHKKILSPEAARGFTTLIEARDGTTIFAIILVGLACVVVGWLFMRWSARRNWSWPVTLPKVVEFRWAMEQFGIDDPGERIAFVRKHKVPVFIASFPLIGKEQEAISAKLYAFAHHYSLGDEEIFERQTGKQTLCLDANDYEHLLKEHGQRTESAYSARIVELEQSIANLQAANSLQSSNIAKLTEENERLLAENSEQRQKLKTAPGREVKAEKRENDKVPLWRVAAPLVNRLIVEAQSNIESNTQYTRPQIQAAFLEELEKFPELKPAIQKLLHTGTKERESTPFSLEGWGMEAIRSALGDFAQTEPRAPKKVKKH